MTTLTMLAAMLIATICFINNLNGEFVIDDFSAIVRNKVRCLETTVSEPLYIGPAL